MPRWAWLATFAIGCGRPATAQSPRHADPPAVTDAGVDAQRTLSDDPARMAARARQLYLDWQVAFAPPDLDCPTATARMNELADNNADLIEANQRVLRAGRDKVKALRAELAKYEAEMEPAAKSVVESPVMSRCANDPAFARAVDRLAGEG